MISVAELDCRARGSPLPALSWLVRERPVLSSYLVSTNTDKMIMMMMMMIGGHHHGQHGLCGEAGPGAGGEQGARGEQ